MGVMLRCANFFKDGQWDIEMMNTEEYNINWNRFLIPYQQAVDELYLKFTSLKTQYIAIGEYSPIQNVAARVKNPDSILEKAKKNGYPLDQLDLMIKDIAGVRIVTQFEEDINLIYGLIKLRTDMKIVTIKDYLSNPKQSGYKSIHLIVEYEVNTVNGPEPILCEIQIRTLAMDFWSTIEHSLNYKYKDAMPQSIKQRLVSAAESITEIDSEMGKIRDEITEAQRLFRQKSQTVNRIIELMNRLSSYGRKALVRKYYKIFTEMRETDNTIQLLLLQKELEKEIKQLSNNQ